ncbi:MAG: MFS transporter [Theionarchaea archaeon]|nr:MFS transporter [Theionarchaea archaeon]MBU7021022.1 MFS transporter [Theionarchaea archaeon]MBU7035694.1 MFS transporter [Theionarchaea archaeon]MBU7040892.1 MFS transporter [Theionarchaea archaeon]
MAAIKDEITDYMDRIRSFSRNSKIFLFSHCLITVGLGIFNVIFNLYILELGYSATFLGIVISSNLIFSAVFLFPGGAISDKIGRKNTLLLSTGLMIGSTIAVSIAQDRYLLLVGNSIRGLSNSLIMVVIAPFMTEQSNPYERMHLFSVDAALRSFSRMIGSLIGGLLPAVLSVTRMTVTVQYQYTLLTAGIFTLLAFFPLFLITEKKKAIITTSSETSLFGQKKKFVGQFVFCSSLIGFGAGVIVPFFNVYFSQVLKATPAQIGLMFSLGELSMGIASLVLPFVVRRYGKVGSIVLTQVLSIPFLLLITVSDSLFPSFIGYFFRTTLMNMASPAQQNFFMDEIPEHERGKANSLSQFGSTFFRALGSDVGGYLLSVGNFNQAFQITGSIYMVGTGLFYFFFRNKNNR